MMAKDMRVANRSSLVMSNGATDMVCFMEICQYMWCVCGKDVLPDVRRKELKKCKTRNVLAMNHLAAARIR